MILELTDKYHFWYIPAIAVFILILCSILALSCQCVKIRASKHIYRFQRRVFDNVVTIVFYPLLFLSIVLFIFEGIVFLVGRWFPDFSICNRSVAYSFILSVFSVLIAIMLALKLNVKKIETGEEFISALRNIIIELNKKSGKGSDKSNVSKPTIHIYTPALCIGVGMMINSMIKDGVKTVSIDKYKSQMRSIIEKYDRVTYVFHTKSIDYVLLSREITGETSGSWYVENKKDTEDTEDKKDKKYNMLQYIANNYFDDINVSHKEYIRLDIQAIVEKVEKKNIIFDYNFEDECAGYYTDIEVLFGKITPLNRKEGISEFCGEIVTSREFMDFIKQNKTALPY